MAADRIVHPWFRPLRRSTLLSVAGCLSLIGVGVLLSMVNHPRMASYGRMLGAAACLLLMGWCCYKAFNVFRKY